jgi:hypothetical protein
MKRALVQKLVMESERAPASLGGTIAADILGGASSVVQFGETKSEDFLNLAKIARNAIKGSVLIKIDEVAHLAALDETLDLLTIPTLMPPWPTFIAEYRERTEYAFGTTHVQLEDVCDVAVLWVTWAAEYDREAFEVCDVDDVSRRVSNDVEWRPAGAAWTCSLITYLRPVSTMRTFGPLVNWIFYLDEAGKFLAPIWPQEPPDSKPSRGPRGIFSISPEYMKDLGETAALTLEPGTFASALAVALTHCKNVSITEHQAPRSERRRAERGGPPAMRYRTLEINPMRQVLHNAAGPSGFSAGGLRRALHIARGHFSHYGEEFGRGKLFGRLEGQFWIPQHVRGTPDRGAVVKDYVVKDG